MLLSNGYPQNFPLQALGEITPMSSTSYWYSHDGLPLVDKWATYGYIYKSQPNVSGVLDKKSKLAARLTPLGVWDYSDPKEPVQNFTSDYAKLMMNPSSFMSCYSFWIWWETTKGIYGEVFGLKLRQGGITASYPSKVVEIVPMHPTRTWIKRVGPGPNGTGEVIAGTLYPPGEEVFTFTLGIAADGLITVPRSEVIVERNYNPDTLMRGLSPMESLTRTIQNEDAIRRGISSTWQRGAMPSLVVTQPNASGTGAAKRIQGKIEMQHSGPDKVGGILVLPTGLEAQPLQIDPQKMQLIESLKFTRDEVISRLDLPPTAIHIMDHATFTNITEQLRSVYRDVMIPRFEELESQLAFDIGAEFSPDGTLRAKFDLSEVLRGDFESRVDSAVKGVTNGLLTPNEGRELMGIDPSDQEEANKLYGNQALQPLGTPVEKFTGAVAGTPGGPDAIATDPAPVVVGAPASPKAQPAQPPEQVTRSIMGRVGRALKANDRVLLRERLTQEHEAALNSVLDKQRAAIKSMGSKAAGSVDLSAWDGPLDDSLNPVITATALAGGTLVAKKVNKKYDVGSMKNYIATTSAQTAKNMNAANATELQQRRDDWETSQGPWDDVVDEFYDTSAASRADLLITSLVTTFLAKSGMEAATFHGMKEKTWEYNAGAKGSRSDHASMNGETVPLQDAFSNGLQIAGDPSGSAADNAGCLCVNDFN